MAPSLSPTLSSRIFNMPLFDTPRIGASCAGGAYTIDQSTRFNDDDSAYLYRTPASAGNRKTFTFSCWVKRANITSANAPIFSAGGDDWLMFLSANTLGFNTSGSNYRIVTTQLFRDPGAWMHVVLRVDTTNATAGDRLRLYINGSEVTDFGTDTNPTLNFDTAFNNTGEHSIGKLGGALQYLDGYLSEIHHVDGSSLAPTSFGETNSDGVWIPKAYTGSYGTNGFYITGADSADLGADDSGNGNDFTSSGLAVADQMLDTPTDNFCTLSPIDKHASATLSDGNLDVTAGGGWYHGRGTMFATSGKWYYEFVPTAGSYALAGWMTGVGGNDHLEEESDPDTTYYRGVGAAGQGVRIGDGTTDTGPTLYALNDVVMMAIDVDTMKFWVGVNGTWYNSGDPGAGTSPTGTWSARSGYPITPWFGVFTSTAMTFNFGQSAFTYTAPTDFNGWSTASLPDPAIADPSAHFQTTLYTGNGTAIGSGGKVVSQSGNSTFQPDLVWIKSRSGATEHVMTDAVRGVTNELNSDSNLAETTIAEGLTTFDTAGFTVGSDTNYNTNTSTYVAWQWLANGAGSSNTDGSINTTATSVNTTAGFSMSTYTGTGSAATVGHGLGVTPSVVLVMPRSNGDHSLISNWEHGVTAFTEKMKLNETEAASASTGQITGGSSTTFSIGTDVGINGNSRTYVAYCWAEVEGFSKFGTYAGNGSTDGPFVYTGFKPAFVSVKRTDAVGYEWKVWDNTRSPYNEMYAALYASSASAEVVTGYDIDFLSNGFKLRVAGGGTNNASGTYIYMAFAETPFKTATAR